MILSLWIAIAVLALAVVLLFVVHMIAAAALVDLHRKQEALCRVIQQDVGQPPNDDDDDGEPLPEPYTLTDANGSRSSSRRAA